MTKNKKLKIEVINKYSYPVAAGIETHVSQVYGNLIRNGFDVTIHASKDTLTKKDSLKDEQIIKGLKIKRYSFGVFGFFPKINWSKTNFVILHNFNVFPHFIILLYSLILKLLKMKKFVLILTPHGGFNPNWHVFPKIQASIKKLYHYTLGTFLINKTVDGIRAVSEWEKSEMVRHGINPDLIKIISNGIEDEAFVNLEKLASQKIKSIVSENQPYIIQVGRIHPIKNYETPIKALAKLPKKLNFLIIGPEQDVQYKITLEKLIRKLGLENRVRFPGVVRGVDKYYLLKHAELMVHMATWEAYCNTVHEGMSQGLVCIVSKNTALEELIVDGINGYHLELDDYPSLAQKINFILEDKNSPTILEMEKRNKLFAAGHSWKNVAKKVEQFYLDILKNPIESGFKFNFQYEKN